MRPFFTCISGGGGCCGKNSGKRGSHSLSLIWKSSSCQMSVLVFILLKYRGALFKYIVWMLYKVRWRIYWKMWLFCISKCSVHNCKVIKLRKKIFCLLCTLNVGRTYFHTCDVCFQLRWRHRPTQDSCQVSSPRGRR